MESKKILDKWATAVIPKCAIYTQVVEDIKTKTVIDQDGVDQEKIAHYEERGYKGDEVLWIPPKDCIRLEFEDTPDHNHRFILEIESVAKSLGYDYCITGHGGKSDYFNMFNIKDMPLNEDNKIAKMLLVDKIIPAMAKKQLDKTNLGWTLSPIIGHEHWKKKYGGRIHKILRGKTPLEHQNRYPKELLAKIKKAKEINNKKIKFIKETSGWVEDFLLNYCVNHPLPQGERHIVIEKNLSAMIAFREDKDQIIQQWSKTQGMNSINGWILAVLEGDYKHVSAGELAKYIKNNNINYTIPEIQVDENEVKNENIRYSSLIINENEIIEQVNKEGKNLFCVYNNVTKEISFVNFINDGNEVIMPINDEEVEKRAVLLPSEPLDYVNDETLENDIKIFIQKWLDIDEETKQFAIWNIKRSWVYERFHTLNYLRALGDTGQGKTRFIDVLGYIHYKPIETSGATTSAPIFRIIDKWKGTLVMDEADLKDSDESNDIIKIINMGYEKGKYVMRCEQNDATKINFFDPYCPKVLATRKPFDDKATESRCITHIMQGTTRKDIPPNLNKEFFDEALVLRNKLLKWRFDNYFVIEPDKTIEFDFGEIEPRMKQIISSFISLFYADKDKLEWFKVYIKEKQEELIEERQNSFAGQIVEAIHNLLKNGQEDISANDIVVQANITGKDGKLVQPRSISKVLKELGLNKTTIKKVEEKAKRCLDFLPNSLENLFKRYGLEELSKVTQVTQVTQVTIQGEGGGCGC